MEDLKRLITEIRGADENAMQDARLYVNTLAAPPGSLGKLADAAVRLAGITGKRCNAVTKQRIIVMCADNGVVQEGVSVTPPSVTLSQAINMTRNLTGMSALAHHFGCEVEVVDVGIATPYNEALIAAASENSESGAPISGILQRRVRRGTGNIAREPAMTIQETLEAISVGIRRAQKAAEDRVNVIGVGEMGIGNTTTSAAVLAALTGLSAQEVTGRGAGLTDTAFLHKKKVIADALTLHHLSPEDYKAAASAGQEMDCIEVISKVGGLDLAAMCGVYLGAAACRLPVVIDGFISVVAALCAVRLCPQSRDFMFPSHVSEEKGYLLAARELDLDPWLHLNMRLGEGSGCPLAFKILEASCALMNDMATFEKASIDDGYLDEIRV